MREFIKAIIVRVLTWEARAVLRKYKPKIVGITGSVGKTSTKDAIYTTLSSSFYVRKNQKSFNAEFGVPLTILGLDTANSNLALWAKNIVLGLAVVLFPNHYPRWLVLEMGVDRPGDMDSLASWLQIDVAVITRLPDVPVHVEFFDSPEEVAKEKKKILKALNKNGVLVVNYDDDELRPLKASEYRRVITFGLEDGADVQATNSNIVYKNQNGTNVPSGINFKVELENSVVPVTVSDVVGVQHIYPVLAGVAVGISQDINLVTAGQSFLKHIVPPSRMRLISGKSGTTIIDDTYNSSPVALGAALDALESVKTSGRKVCILADMTELGKFTVENHKKLGERAKSVCELIVAVGPRARYFAEGAREVKMPKSKIVLYKDSNECVQHVSRLIRDGDTILIKGSQSMRMERVTKALMAEPAHASELLVRQEKAWLAHS